MVKKATNAPKAPKVSKKAGKIAKDTAPVLSKQKSTQSEKKSTSKKDILDLCLLMDCTSSMQVWIERSKDTLKDIINNVKLSNPELEVRVCFVGYRDIKDEVRFCIQDFSEDIELVKTFISKQVADGGRDWPEDVQGGLDKALKANWSANSIKQAFLIADAPGHGVEISGDAICDEYPKGSPDGFDIKNQMHQFANRRINFTIVKVNEDCNLMFNVMQNAYNSIVQDQAKITVSDLAKAVQNKTKAEVTEDFIKSASYIITAALGNKKPAKPAQPLWDTK